MGKKAWPVRGTIIWERCRFMVIYEYALVESVRDFDKNHIFSTNRLKSYSHERTFDNSVCLAPAIGFRAPRCGGDSGAGLVDTDEQGGTVAAFPDG